MTDQSPKDKARALLFNGYVRRTELHDCGNGVTIELRQPTVGQRSRILQRGGLNTNGEIDDLGALQLATVIECCYCAESGERLFDWTDEDIIKGLPSSSWFDEVSTKAMGLMSTEPAQAGKRSSETTSD
jgi:hypothetical protein